jgi:predicted TIM-barrel fold metal-dependent hydrolase
MAKRAGGSLIVDFQHHYTPPEFLGPRQRAEISQLDANGNPESPFNPLICDLPAHIRMMDKAGIDVAVLSSGAGFDNQDAASCRRLNDLMKKAEVDFPGRFLSLGHVPSLKGAEAVAELERCKRELGLPGVAIGSELKGKSLDAEELGPFWAACERLDLYVFVHPLGGAIAWNQMYADDLARAVGWEFSLIAATIRLINRGVLDRHPGLRVQFAHFCGGVAHYLPRLRGFAQHDRWFTADVPNHNRKPARSLDHYLRERLMYDCAGWAGPNNAAAWGMDWIRNNLASGAVSQTVFASDYPRAVNDDDEMVSYVAAYRKLDAAATIDANATKLIAKLPVPTTPR